MSTPTQLNRRTKTDYTHFITIFFAKQSHCSQLFCLSNRHLTMLFQRNILTHFFICQTLNFTQLVFSYFLEVREVKPKAIRSDQRTFLLNMSTQYFTQCFVQQSLSFFVDSYSDVSLWRAVIERLDGFERMLEHIAVHRYFMGLDLKRDISEQEAVTHWYDKVYLPIVKVIRKSRILKEFPGKTEGDLYLWVLDHQHYLAEQEGQPLQTPEEAARGFLEKNE